MRLWIMSAMIQKGSTFSHMAHWALCETEAEARKTFLESIQIHKPGFEVYDMPPAIRIPDDCLRRALGEKEKK